MIERTMPGELRSKRLRYRPWRAEDAPQLLPILEANREHLAGWIPRHVAEPLPVPELAARLRGFTAEFESDREWRYAIVSADREEILGEVSLFPRNSRERTTYSDADRAEIGYWLKADATGRGFATEAARIMLGLASALPGIRRVEIRCDTRSIASAAVPRRLGFTLATPVEEASMIWSMDVSRPAASRR
jgi:RimJ/RimL family protein N-acetyltransferase